jgi:hypothetical protein
VYLAKDSEKAMWEEKDVSGAANVPETSSRSDATRVPDYLRLRLVERAPPPKIMLTPRMNPKSYQLPEL